MAKSPDPVSKYARAVVKGKIVTGKLVRLACERHLDDLKHAKERGLYFDRDAVHFMVGFFKLLRHTIGEWSGESFTLEPWQVFILGSIVGWKRADGTRRFRNVYIEVARKNGKSCMLAGLGLYLMVADGEPGAHVYSAATTRDQAKIVFGEAERMVSASPSLRKRVGSFVNNLHVLETSSKFQPLSADASKMDGLNVHGALVDEVHEHPNGEVLQKLETAMGARRQPILVEITTAGYDRHSICYQHNDYSQKIVNRIIQNDSWFAYIATIDDEDDWTDPECWIKANPNLNVTVKQDDLQKQVDQAREMPAQQNSIRRLRLNQWVEQSVRWLDMEVWDDGAKPEFDVDDLAGRPCYLGLDLARVNDLTALSHIFPPIYTDEKWKVLMRFWIPEEDIYIRSKRDRVPYDVWLRDGLVESTPGNTTDFAFIEKAILETTGLYDVKELSYDRTFAGEIIQNLMNEEVPVVPFGQGFISMGPATAELERLLLSRQFLHNGNPVLRWCASNVAVREDPAGNKKPDKERSMERIDGIVAICNAIGRAMLGDNEPGSVYENRGVITL